MRHIYTALFVLSLLGLTMACEKQSSLESDQFVDFHAEISPSFLTKTAISLEGKKYHPHWVESDKIGFFTQHDTAPVSNGQMTVSTVRSDGSATLSGQVSSGANQFFAYYPWNKDNASSDKSKIKLAVNDIQFATKNSFDGTSDVMVSSNNTTVEIVLGSSVKFDFRRLSSVMKVNLTFPEGFNGNITDVIVTAPGKALAGQREYNLTDPQSSSQVLTDSGSDHVRLKYHNLKVEGTMPVFANIWPVAFNSDDQLKITVVGNGFVFNKTLTVKSSFEIAESTVSEINIPLTTEDMASNVLPLLKGKNVNGFEFGDLKVKDDISKGYYLAGWWVSDPYNRNNYIVASADKYLEGKRSCMFTLTSDYTLQAKRNDMVLNYQTVETNPNKYLPELPKGNYLFTCAVMVDETSVDMSDSHLIVDYHDHSLTKPYKFKPIHTIALPSEKGVWVRTSAILSISENVGIFTLRLNLKAKDHKPGLKFYIDDIQLLPMAI